MEGRKKKPQNKVEVDLLSFFCLARDVMQQNCDLIQYFCTYNHFEGQLMEWLKKMI